MRLSDLKDAQNGGPINVTFEPGCRNNWHSHHDAVQVLICVAGRGWYQEWGKNSSNETMELREQSQARLRSAESRQSSSETQWLEPVTDEVYGKLK